MPTRTNVPVAYAPNSVRAIHSGVPWFDQNGRAVSAHGGGILKEGDRFYFFGEFKRDGGNAFAGFSCYSSRDLMNWTFERMALPVQPDGILGPDRVGERPKVLKCPGTGEFVMFMHTDSAAYKDQAVGYATSSTVDGEYVFRGWLLFDGQPIKLWDMSVLMDDDGAGYLVTHSGNLFRLADDYKSVTAQVVTRMTEGCEAPAIFKRGSLYYWLGSHLTSWERNDNDYFTATSLAGPWTKRGYFAPEGSLTWNSQTTFVLPIVGAESTTFMFMGDRWAHPYQCSAATCVWQPLCFDDAGNISLPTYQPAWRIDLETGRWSPVSSQWTLTRVVDHDRMISTGVWHPSTDTAGLSSIRSDQKGSSLTIAFVGTQIGLVGVARPDGGFAEVRLSDATGQTILTSIIEIYCRYPETSLKFLSPTLPRAEYRLTVTVLGEHFFWQAKTTTHGSSGDFIEIASVAIVD